MSAANSHSVRLISGDESQTQRLAATLARQCLPGDCILLNGDLGAGKTAFARGFIQTLSPASTEIVSPTFNLVQTYPAGRIMIWHFDLYRLKTPQDTQEIGLDEALQSGITLIEWPELAKDVYPPSALHVHITLGSAPDERQLSFSGLAAHWKDRLCKL